MEKIRRLMGKINITVMIPALNEEDNLEATVGNVIWAKDQVDNLSLEIFIVNDGSTDRTPQVCKDLAARHDIIRVIHHEKSRGLGGSFKEVILMANGEKFMFIPGDNDLSHESILLLFKNIYKADLVLCFYLNREFRGRMRNTLSTLFGLIYMSVFNIFIQYINSPCIYPVAMLREIDFISNGFSIAAEIIIKLLKKGVTFHEIPGYMQTGLKGSKSFSLNSMWEVIKTFIKLVYEIMWAKKHEYNKTPVRIWA